MDFSLLKLVKLLIVDETKSNSFCSTYDLEISVPGSLLHQEHSKFVKTLEIHCECNSLFALSRSFLFGSPGTLIYYYLYLFKNYLKRLELVAMS